jgi:ketosteroid isomerase-like protein
VRNEVLNGLLYNICEIYLDDCIVYADTKEEYLIRLEALYRRFSEKGIFLQREQCKFELESIDYFGHVVSAQGYSSLRSREKGI